MPKRATPDGSGKRVPLMARTTISLRQSLEAAAAESGRSLAQEVETRLERSLQNDELLEVFVGNEPHSRMLMTALALTIKRMQMVAGERWVDHYNTLWECRRGAEAILNVAMGLDAGPPERPADRPEDEHKRLLGRHMRVVDETLRDLGMIVPTRAAGIQERVVRMAIEKGAEEK